MEPAFRLFKVFDELLKEPYREERRIQLGRSKFVDIFFYSGVYDYPWHQINFADFDRIAEQILKWSLIIASSITFAISPLFRCAIICVLFGALGKNGQNLLTVVVFNSLSSGPIENILQNFKVSTNMITCHIKQKEDMMTQRVVMATGPVEAFMAREFGKSTSKGRKVIAMLKSLVEPLEYDFTLSDEDKALAATIDAAEVLHTRDSLLNKEPENSKEGLGIKTQKSVVPTWNKLKSNLSKLLSIRMHYQCNEVFDKGVKKCHDAFRDMKVTEALTFCNQMTNQVLSRTKNLDSDLTDAHNLTEDILDHLRVNMHYRAIVEPRNVRIYGIKEVKPPTKAEIRASWLPLAKFTFIFVISLFVVKEASEEKSDTKALENSFQIEGTGFVADLVKEMLEFDYKSHRNLTISLEKCHIWLCDQTCYSFCVIGNIFRKRNKARIIHLYNKMLFVRINGRKLARARIRFQVQRRILQREELQKKAYCLMKLKTFALANYSPIR
ncbi:hypothetical protein DINM_022620 [Dirofilaria immitis]|nr:hypothetical protein [Dirofilaria immitis]